MRKLTSLEPIRWLNRGILTIKIGRGSKAEGRVEIEANWCKGCLLCIEVCPPGVLVISKSLNKMGYHPAEYVGERCTACGFCFYICSELGSISNTSVLARNRH